MKDLDTRMTNDFTQEVKKPIIEHFARHDIDDLHQYAGAQAMLEQYNKVFDMKKVVKVLKHDLKNYISGPK